MEVNHINRPLLKVVTHDLGIDTEEAHIIPLSDLHIGSTFNEDKFDSYRKWILNTPNAYCILCGDVINLNTKNSVGSVFEDLRPKEQRILAVKHLKPLADAGKILAYIDGNHEGRTRNETDEYIGETICAHLGIPNVYSPDGIFMYLSVGYNRRENKRTRNVYTALMLHGWSGARTMGGKMNNLESLAKIAVADLYVMGHVHTKSVFPRRIVMPDKRAKNLSWKKQVFVSTGSFLDWDGYAIRKGYTPASLGAPRITLSGFKDDIHVSI